MIATKRKKARPPRDATADRSAKFAAAVRRAAEAEADPRLRAWLLKLLDGDARERSVSNATAHGP